MVWITQNKPCNLKQLTSSKLPQIKQIKVIPHSSGQIINIIVVITDHRTEEKQARKAIHSTVSQSSRLDMGLIILIYF